MRINEYAINPPVGWAAVYSRRPARTERRSWGRERHYAAQTILRYSRRSGIVPA